MVLVESLDPEVEKHGLTKVRLQRDAEPKLRKAGIAVLTEEECFNTPGKPFVYLHVSTHKTDIGLYDYLIRIELNQAISLIRAPSIRTSAATWTTGTVGIVGARNLPMVTEDAAQLLDRFIDAYLALNSPK